MKRFTGTKRPNHTYLEFCASRYREDFIRAFWIYAMWFEGHLDDERKSLELAVIGEGKTDGVFQKLITCADWLAYQWQKSPFDFIYLQSSGYTWIAKQPNPFQEELDANAEKLNQ